MAVAFLDFWGMVSQSDCKERRKAGRRFALSVERFAPIPCNLVNLTQCHIYFIPRMYLNLISIYNTTYLVGVHVVCSPHRLKNECIHMDHGLFSRAHFAKAGISQPSVLRKAQGLRSDRFPYVPGQGRAAAPEEKIGWGD